MITAPKIPPLPHTWHGPGWWDQATPTAPYHSERRLAGVPRVVAGGCWEESPEQAVTTLFSGNLVSLDCPLRPGRQGREAARKKSLGPLGSSQLEPEVSLV